MLNRAALVNTLSEERARTIGRYVGVSTINFVGHQVLLYLSNSVWGWQGGWANVFSACVLSLPAYLLSRAWVWEIDGKHDLRSEVLPFWTIAVVGLFVSTLFAAIADRTFGAGLAVNLASLLGYFIVWIAKFFLLDRIFVAQAAARAMIIDSPT